MEVVIFVVALILAFMIPRQILLLAWVGGFALCILAPPTIPVAGPIVAVAIILWILKGFVG